MIHENNLVIGYGFLIRRDDREHVEELREWFTQVVREYPAHKTKTLNSSPSTMKAHPKARSATSWKQVYITATRA